MSIFMGSLRMQAERKRIAALTRKPDLGNANVGIIVKSNGIPFGRAVFAYPKTVIDICVKFLKQNIFGRFLQMKSKRLVTTAMLLALAVILSLIKVFELPFGGAVTAASMMPIILVSYIYGTKWGIFSAFVYSVLQMLTGMNTISAFFMPGESQMAIPAALGVCLIDYVLAFSALGLGGIFKGKIKNDILAIGLGAIVALFVRYIFHIISGSIFFGAWAEWFFGDAASGLAQIPAFKGFCNWVLSSFSGSGLSIFYSIVYNGAYMIPEIIITAVITPVIYKVLKRANIIG